MALLAGQRTQPQLGAWSGREYGSFAGKTASVVATLGDVIIATVRSLSPQRSTASLMPKRSTASLMPKRTVEKL